MKKAWLFSNWHGGVMVKAVVHQAQGGEDRFPAGPRALLRWFQSGGNRLGRMKKGWRLSNWYGRVIVKAVVHQAQGGEDRFPAWPRPLLNRPRKYLNLIDSNCDVDESCP